MERFFLYEWNIYVSYKVIYTVKVNLRVVYLNALLEELKGAYIFRLVLKREKNDDALIIDQIIHKFDQGPFGKQGR